MGLLFSPLTAIAISEIPNYKMAQASGLINVTRQIGGSLGVAVFGSLLTRRTAFHAATFGQQLDSGSAMFKQTVKQLSSYAIQSSGGTTAEATAKARVLLYSFVQKQAFISGVGDVFFAAGIAVLLSALPVIILRTHKRKKGPGATAIE